MVHIIETTLVITWNFFKLWIPQAPEASIPIDIAAAAFANFNRNITILYMLEPVFAGDITLQNDYRFLWNTLYHFIFKVNTNHYSLDALRFNEYSTSYIEIVLDNYELAVEDYNDFIFAVLDETSNI